MGSNTRDTLRGEQQGGCEGQSCCQSHPGQCKLLPLHGAQLRVIHQTETAAWDVAGCTHDENTGTPREGNRVCYLLRASSYSLSS
jgi:hypothetical protein